MPLEQRVVKPIFICRSTLPFDSQGNPISIANELEYVTNGTLANIIRQLSSLSKYAEDLFAGLLHEATVTIARLTSLQGRVDRLSVKVTQLDSSVDEVSLKDINQNQRQETIQKRLRLRKQFKSCASYDQQVVARGTMPESIREVYELCDSAPPLDKLNAYRDDGKDGLKFYTDPNYFFDLWRKEMDSFFEETEKERIGKKNAHRGPGKGEPGSGDKSRQRKPRQPVNTRREFFNRFAQQEFLDDNSVKSTVSGTPITNGGPIYRDSNGTIVYGNQYVDNLNRPNSLELNHGYRVDGYHQHQQVPNSYQQQHPHHMMVQQQPSLSNQNPTYYAHPGMNNDHCQYHPGNMSNQSYAHINSPRGGPSTPPPPYNYISPGGGNTVNIGMSAGEDMSISQSHNQGTPTRRISASGPMIANRPSQPPPAPPSNPSSSNSSAGGTPNAGTPNRSRGQSLTRDTLPPPPPPPPPGSGIMMNGPGSEGELSLPPPASSGVNSDQHLSSQTNIPPPPPLPPGGLIASSTNNEKQDNEHVTDGIKPSENGLMASSTLAQEILQKQKMITSKMNTMNKILPQNVVQQHNHRSDLLAAIREGKVLRKVDENRKKAIEQSTPLLDVASILARRKAMEYSDSESDGGNSDETGSDYNWEVESEC